MARLVKWVVSIAIILGLLLGLAALYTRLVVNPKVVAELVNSPDGEKAARVMLLTLPEGQVLPVNYLREDSLVFVGADGGWWRQFRPDDAAVTLMIKGIEYSGRARAVLDSPDYTAEIFTKLRPTAPAWLPAWLNGKLIVIELESPGFSLK